MSELSEALISLTIMGALFVVIIAPFELAQKLAEKGDKQCQKKENR